jgi:hypothetical protein
MKYAALLTLLALGGVTASQATDLPPFAGQCAALDRVAAAAANARTESIAIDSLEKIALGRAAGIGAEADATLGMAAGTLEDKGFADPTARACALRSLGRTALGGAIEFLTKLTPADLGSDPSQRLWPAAQVALREAQLRGITDTYLKTEFLDRTVTEHHDAVSNSAVTSWAVDELCDRGAQVSLPVIQQSIRSRRNGPRDEQEIEFCEARIRVVASNPDRVKALASVLTAGGDATNTRLAGWAVNALNSMQTPAADAELDRFAREIEKLPEGSPTKAHLDIYRQEIMEFRGQRVK